MWILLTALRSFARSGPLQTGHSTLTFSLLLMSPFTPAPCIQHYQDGECVLEPRPVIISFTQQNWTLIPVERVWHSNTDMQAMLDSANFVQYNKYTTCSNRLSPTWNWNTCPQRSSPKVCFADCQILYAHWLSNIACMSSCQVWIWEGLILILNESWGWNSIKCNAYEASYRSVAQSPLLAQFTRS